MNRIPSCAGKEKVTSLTEVEGLKIKQSAIQMTWNGFHPVVACVARVEPPPPQAGFISEMYL